MLAIELFYMNFSLRKDNKLYFYDVHKSLALFELSKRLAMGNFYVFEINF